MSKIDFTEAHAKATTAAAAKAQELFDKHGELSMCGFAWIEAPKVRGNTKVGKAMMEIGFSKSYSSKGYQLWNPSKYGGQSIDIKEEAAYVYADVFKAETGIEVYVNARLD